MCLLAICISSSFSLLPFSLAAPWGRWDFSNKNKPMAPAVKCGVLTTESPGKSQRYFLNPGGNLGVAVLSSR